MSYDQLESRIGFVVYGENKWRINIVMTKSGTPEVTYDAHGQSVREAKRTLENIVNCSLTPLRLNVIHGYNHGTAIKDMLEGETFSGRIAEKTTPRNNPGMTKLVLTVC